MRQVNRIIYQRGHVLLTCLLITTTVFMLVIGVGQLAQLGWRQVNDQWQATVRQTMLVLALNTIADQIDHWAQQPCAHLPLTWSDAQLRDTKQWQMLAPCQLIFSQQNIQFIVEHLAMQSAYRISATLTNVMQQLTVTVDNQGSVRRQAWRNVV
ncbi:MAG: hypothetical protein GKR77_00615 [Legionellales bacterium]|nr:hypothetical protein [Legionellales bacterium]